MKRETFMKLYYETKRDEVFVENTVKRWIKDKQLHKHEKYIKPNLYMIDCYQWDQPNQAGIAESLAHDHIDLDENNEDKVKRLSEKYYLIMDRNFPTSAINFMIKNKLGVNIDDLLNGRYLRLDVYDVVNYIMEDEKKLASLKKDEERAIRKITGMKIPYENIEGIYANSFIKVIKRKRGTKAGGLGQ